MSPKPKPDPVVEDDTPATTDETPDEVAFTEPVSGADAYIVWDAQNQVFRAGPFATQEDAQVWLNHAEEQASRTVGYEGATLSIGTVVGQ